MSTTVSVRFTKPWRTYFPGDVAGFEKDIADALVGAGWPRPTATSLLARQLTRRRSRPVTRLLPDEAVPPRWITDRLAPARKRRRCQLARQWSLSQARTTSGWKTWALVAVREGMALSQQAALSSMVVAVSPKKKMTRSLNYGTPNRIHR